MQPRGWLAACLLAAATTACGPIEYVNHTTMGASDKVEAARAADAEKWSPYWWTRAVEYLRKSRDEAGYSHWQAANKFGQLSEDAAQKAREEALRRAADPAAAAKEMGPIDGAPIVIPTPGPVKPPAPDAKTPAKPDSKAKLAPVEDGS